MLLFILNQQDKFYPTLILSGSIIRLMTLVSININANVGIAIVDIRVNLLTANSQLNTLKLLPKSASPKESLL